MELCLSRNLANFSQLLSSFVYLFYFSNAYWTTELFKVRKVQPTQPVTYLLEDLHDRPIKGSFYSYELQKTECPDVYLVEKVVRKDKKKLLVKWLGFDSTHNSFIERKDFV